MRGQFEDQGRLFSYISPEERVPKGHPLRAVRSMVRSILAGTRLVAKLYKSHQFPESGLARRDGKKFIHYVEHIATCYRRSTQVLIRGVRKMLKEHGKVSFITSRDTLCWLFPDSISSARA